jgi:Transglycosylase SLT domain
MAEVPNSYKDPFWSDLASKAERKHGLPGGLLVNVITKGERTNNDQVSDAGAKTVFQITPDTRKRILDKYKIDPYLSPQNAAEGAALLLKEGLQRNGGDVSQAVGEYVGGIDRKNWGPVTRNYISRVTAGESTFQRAMASRQTDQSPQIAGILDAYRSGRMTPEDARSFERDVNSGAIMLPEGESLKAQAKKQVGNIVPSSVVDAYLNGKMTPEDMQSFREDIKFGLIDVPDGYGSYFEGSKAKTGLQMMEKVQPGVAPTTRPKTTIGEDVVGAGEAALSVATGAVAGPVAVIGGLGTAAVQQMTGQPSDAQRTAGQIAEAMTYQPRGQAGQETLRAVGEALAPLRLEGLGPMTQGIQAAQMAPAAAQAVRGVVQQAAPAAIQRVQQVAAPIARAAEVVRERITPQGFGAGRSVGSAETPASTVRRERAMQMPVPFEGESALTKGQASRDFNQLQFEKETAKAGDTGADLRQRAMNQGEVLMRWWTEQIRHTSTSRPLAVLWTVRLSIAPMW